MPSDRTRDEARSEYLPAGEIDVLFIAEAPPADPTRFFYFERVDRHDWLYLGLMRVLFRDARDLEVRQLREQKTDYLERFMDRGYYLIDASDQPMPMGVTDAAKRTQLRASLDSLVAKVRSLTGPHTRVVLISKSVHDACSARLKAEGFNVINAEAIDFPSSGRQLVFASKLRRDLQSSDEFLQATIRGLEESIKYFGAGEAKKRERARWIVERFLRGLGVDPRPDEIEQPTHDPPDARFRGAAFEVKEIQTPGRTRGDEYRQALERAKAAVSSAELLEEFSPQDLPIAEAYRLIMDQARELATRKYVNAVDRQGLDLLFYLDLDMPLAWDIKEGVRPDIAPLIQQGWRSVSFLHGTSTVCVILATQIAPDFLAPSPGTALEGQQPLMDDFGLTAA